MLVLPDALRAVPVGARLAVAWPGCLYGDPDCERGDEGAGSVGVARDSNTHSLRVEAAGWGRGTSRGGGGTSGRGGRGGGARRRTAQRECCCEQQEAEVQQGRDEAAAAGLQRGPCAAEAERDQSQRHGCCRARTPLLALARAASGRGGRARRTLCRPCDMHPVALPQGPVMSGGKGWQLPMGPAGS